MLYVFAKNYKSCTLFANMYNICHFLFQQLESERTYLVVYFCFMAAWENSTDSNLGVQVGIWLRQWFCPVHGCFRKFHGQQFRRAIWNLITAVILSCYKVRVNEGTKFRGRCGKIYCLAILFLVRLWIIYIGIYKGWVCMVCFVVLQDTQKLNGCAICNAHYFLTSSDIWISRSSSTTYGNARLQRYLWKC